MRKFSPTNHEGNSGKPDENHILPPWTPLRSPQLPSCAPHVATAQPISFMSWPIGARESPLKSASRSPMPQCLFSNLHALSWPLYPSLSHLYPPLPSFHPKSWWWIRMGSLPLTSRRHSRPLLPWSSPLRSFQFERHAPRCPRMSLAAASPGCSPAATFPSPFLQTVGPVTTTFFACDLPRGWIMLSPNQEKNMILEAKTPRPVANVHASLPLPWPAPRHRSVLWRCRLSTPAAWKLSLEGEETTALHHGSSSRKRLPNVVPSCSSC